MVSEVKFGAIILHVHTPFNIKVEKRVQLGENASLHLLFTTWVQGPYQEIQAQGFSYSPSLRGLFGKPRACISWYDTSTQLVNSLLYDPF